MSLKCFVTLLLLHLFRLGHSQSVVGPTTYVIGNTFNLTWNSSLFSDSTVDISLQYNDGQSLMLVNVPNNGNALSQLPDFERDPSHLLVPNDVTGQWVVSSDSSPSQMSNNISIYQPLIFDTMGGVLDLNTPFTISVTLNERIQFTDFSAYLVFLDSQQLWNATYMLNVTNVNTDLRNTDLTLNLPANTNLVQNRNYYLVVFGNGMQFSGINGGASFSSWSYLFIPYDSSQIMMTLGNNNNPLVRYSSVPMNVCVGNELDMSYLYIALKDDFLTMGNQSVYMELQCNSSMASQYNQFGWLFNNVNGNMSGQIYGNYTMELYYNPMTSFDNIAGDSSYKLYTYDMVEIQYRENVIPAITLDRDDYMDDNKSITVKKGENLNVHITSTAFNTPVRISYEWVQYYYGTNESSQIFQSDEDPEVVSEYPYKLQLTVPKEALISNETNKEITLRLYTFDCQHNRFGSSEYTLSLKKKSHSTNKLSAGAIVGIVCAGVLICGLAAWYLAMSRNSPGGDGYQDLNKD